MKPPWLSMALGLFALAGCVTTPPPVQIAPTRSEPISVPPVRAEQVTAQNAHKLSEALADELDREVQQAIRVTSPRKQ